LAATVKTEELLTLPVETLLQRLFHEEIEHGGGVRVYPARPIEHHCPEKWEQIRAMVLSLGRSEAEAILAEQGEILIHDDICNRDYRFSAEEWTPCSRPTRPKPGTDTAGQLLAEDQFHPPHQPPTLHRAAGGGYPLAAHGITAYLCRCNAVAAQGRRHGIHPLFGDGRL